MTLVRHIASALVDYAGLFPPAGLDMRLATQNYESYQAGEYAWALGRFVIPASRLREFPGGFAQLSALCGPNVEADLETVQHFNERGDGVIADVVEIKASTPERIVGVPARLTAYFEIPLDGATDEMIAAIAENGARAKVRTGGVTAEAFPASRKLARFLETCSSAGVAFKATAGLHHALRGSHRLTYEENSPSAVMYGFLNLFLGAAFLRADLDPELLPSLLEEQNAFEFDDSGVSWRGQRVSAGQIAEARERFAISFGSCSFEEPIEDLKSLRLL